MSDKNLVALSSEEVRSIYNLICKYIEHQKQIQGSIGKVLDDLIAHGCLLDNPKLVGDLSEDLNQREEEIKFNELILKRFRESVVTNLIELK